MIRPHLVIFLGAEHRKFFTKNIFIKNVIRPSYLYFLTRSRKIFLQRKSLIKENRPYAWRCVTTRYIWFPFGLSPSRPWWETKKIHSEKFWNRFSFLCKSIHKKKKFAAAAPTRSLNFEEKKCQF